MADMTVLYRTPKDIEAFDKHYFETHVPLAKKPPGLRSYEVSKGPIKTPAGSSERVGSCGGRAHAGSGRARWRGWSPPIRPIRRCAPTFCSPGERPPRGCSDELSDEARARLLDPAIMDPPIVWLASTEADDVNDERIVATEFRSGWPSADRSGGHHSPRPPRRSLARALFGHEPLPLGSNAASHKPNPMRRARRVSRTGWACGTSGGLRRHRRALGRLGDVSVAAARVKCNSRATARKHSSCRKLILAMRTGGLRQLIALRVGVRYISDPPRSGSLANPGPSVYGPKLRGSNPRARYGKTWKSRVFSSVRDRWWSSLVPGFGPRVEEAMEDGKVFISHAAVDRAC